LEIIQGTLIPQRSCDFFDFLSNSAGAGFGFLVFLFFFKNSKYHQRF
jgi:glycopeptide antibiotics resistance protein